MQADVGQEAEPAADLLEQLLGDRPRERVERSRQRLRRASRSGGVDCAGEGVEEPATSPIGIDPSSTRVLPPTRTARARALSRAPWQSGQVMLRM